MVQEIALPVLVYHSYAYTDIILYQFRCAPLVVTRYLLIAMSNYKIWRRKQHKICNTSATSCFDFRYKFEEINYSSTDED